MSANSNYSSLRQVESSQGTFSFGSVSTWSLQRKKSTSWHFFLLFIFERDKLQLLSKGKECNSKADLNQGYPTFIDSKIRGTAVHFKFTTPTSQQASKVMERLQNKLNNKS